MDKVTIRKIYEGFHRCLKPNGTFIVGSAESIFDYSDLFSFNKSADGIYYTKTEAK